MDLSITTDYIDSHDDPIPHLREVRSGGFTRLHWCHEWNTDYLYSSTDIARIRDELVDLGLKIDNLHASEGQEVSWGAADGSARSNGVSLVKNRIDMTAEFGGASIILHASAARELESQRRSMDELLPHAHNSGVRIALENLPREGFSRAGQLVHEFSDDALGYCFDTGHAVLNDRLGFDDFGDIESQVERLVAIHLHDNSGAGDEHRLPFTGVVPWERVARLIASSPYRGCLTLEVIAANEAYSTRREFLNAAVESGRRVAEMTAEVSRGPDAGGDPGVTDDPGVTRGQ